MAAPSQAPGAAGPPPEVQARIQRTVAWAEDRFAAYYQQAPLQLPSRFGRREFGFMFLAKQMMVRHTAFAGGEELRRYLVERAPGHVYYSTAYYENPRAEAMKDKGWLGADLIFDLDADHVEGAKDKGFEEMLRIIQREAVKLAQDFLLGDFGFKAEHIRAVFSGGRGYHLHVSAAEVLQLGSAERREIVDYVEGVGLELERLIGERVVAVKEGKGGRRQRLKRTEALPDSPGWSGRIVRAEMDLLQDLLRMEEPAARERLKQWGIPAKKVSETLRKLRSEVEDKEGRTILQRVAETGWLPTGDELDKVLRAEAVQRAALAARSGEADEPVTSDVKRLIRLPGSVHGKTALRVVPVPLGRLDEFDPLSEALAFGDAPVEVVVSKPETVRIGEKVWELQPGPARLPEQVALFVALRRKALLA